MKREKLREKPWYSYTVAACAAVVLYVVLTHIGTVADALHTVGSFIYPVVVAAVLAYLMNPLAKLCRKYVFRKVKNPSTQWALSITLTIIVVLLVLAVLLVALIPQFVKSIVVLFENLNGYVESLENLLREFSDSALGSALNIEELVSSSEGVLETVISYLTEHAGQIFDQTVVAGKTIVNFVIAFILAIYFLAGKDSLRKAVRRLMRALMSEERDRAVCAVIRRCDVILIRYIAFSLLDALIIGVANAAFMLITGMPYVVVVSFFVAVTNLIPTFGPFIGGVIGAFILVLVRPWYAFWFIIFTLVLQGLDGYVIKPKLFGNSLGVSGLWILVMVIVGGRIFGVIGILLAIPVAAILDFMYRDYLLPRLEERRGRKTPAPEEPED